jgi:hypothetical protein
LVAAFCITSNDVASDGFYVGFRKRTTIFLESANILIVSSMPEEMD